jgi:hypothetical protein
MSCPAIGRPAAGLLTTTGVGSVSVAVGLGVCAVVGVAAGIVGLDACNSDALVAVAEGAAGVAVAMLAVAWGDAVFPMELAPEPPQPPSSTTTATITSPRTSCLHSNSSVVLTEGW